MKCLPLGVMSAKGCPPQLLVHKWEINNCRDHPCRDLCASLQQALIFAGQQVQVPLWRTHCFGPGLLPGPVLAGVSEPLCCLLAPRRREHWAPGGSPLCSASCATRLLPALPRLIPDFPAPHHEHPGKPMPPACLLPWVPAELLLGPALRVRARPCTPSPFCRARRGPPCRLRCQPSLRGSPARAGWEDVFPPRSATWPSLGLVGHSCQKTSSSSCKKSMPARTPRTH